MPVASIPLPARRGSGIVIVRRCGRLTGSAREDTSDGGEPGRAGGSCGAGRRRPPRRAAPAGRAACAGRSLRKADSPGVTGRPATSTGTSPAPAACSSACLSASVDGVSGAPPSPPPPPPPPPPAAAAAAGARVAAGAAQQRPRQDVAAVGVLVEVVRDVAAGVADLARRVVAGEAAALALAQDLVAGRVAPAPVGAASRSASRAMRAGRSMSRSTLATPTHGPARKLRSAHGRAGGDGPGSDRAAADQNQRG